MTVVARNRELTTGLPGWVWDGEGDNPYPYFLAHGVREPIAAPRIGGWPCRCCALGHRHPSGAEWYAPTDAAPQWYALLSCRAATALNVEFLQWLKCILPSKCWHFHKRNREGFNWDKWPSTAASRPMISRARAPGKGPAGVRQTCRPQDRGRLQGDGIGCRQWAPRTRLGSGVGQSPQDRRHPRHGAEPLGRNRAGTPRHAERRGNHAPDIALLDQIPQQALVGLIAKTRHATNVIGSSGERRGLSQRRAQQGNDRPTVAAPSCR
jgi:hypothetical protein